MTPLGIYQTGATGLEPATSGVTGRRSNQLNYAPTMQLLYYLNTRLVRLRTPPILAPSPSARYSGRRRT